MKHKIAILLRSCQHGAYTTSLQNYFFFFSFEGSAEQEWSYEEVKVDMLLVTINEDLKIQSMMLLVKNALVVNKKLHLKKYTGVDMTKECNVLNCTDQFEK